MTRTPHRLKLLAVLLSALAGFVDATGFLALGGFFVSFMSGNTTRLAVGLSRDPAAAVLAAALIGVFVLGVMAGTLARRSMGRHGAAAVLMLVALLLALAASLGAMRLANLAAAAMVLAMGAENAVFERDGEVHIGLTYMTGTLVKLGQHLTRALTGGARWDWVPYLLLWLGLAGGAAAGALAWPHLGLANLWPAAATAALAAMLARRLMPDQPGVLE